MTRSTLFDRLNQELESFGRKAQAAIDEGRVQIELLRMRRQRDNAARDLGMLVYRRERGGGEVEPRRVDALLLRLDDIQAEITRLEQRVAEGRRPAEEGAAAHGGATAGSGAATGSMSDSGV
jgi:hypothetical protein